MVSYNATTNEQKHFNHETYKDLYTPCVCGISGVKQVDKERGWLGNVPASQYQDVD